MRSYYTSKEEYPALSQRPIKEQENRKEPGSSQGRRTRNPF